MVIPDLIEDGINDALIILALEQEHLDTLNWRNTFPLLIHTAEKVADIDRDKKIKVQADCRPDDLPYREYDTASSGKGCRT